MLVTDSPSCPLFLSATEGVASSLTVDIDSINGASVAPKHAPASRDTEKMNTDSQISKSDPNANPGVEEAYRLVVLEIKQLEQARRNISARLEKAVSARDLLRQLILSDTSEHEDSKASSNAGLKRKKPTKHHRGSLTGEIVKRSRAILLSAGRPLERSELLEEIERDGFKVKASNPARFIGRTLWESEEFIHVPKAGYWIKGQHLPEAE
ncbi:hypothetical protein C9413_29975 [Rhizobium sp. SEMIA 4085]|uniref:Uncharacterized protein n=1 Tax=Rhizobium gallicum bv. gallicum R602sp TaxID=1041138 RepID=A0A0B4X565_9HYPH|nr:MULTISPECIES: hypothetical protein [Rhizobium]AJD41673.1 hypothetical protein RGR602_CH02347 [Rhizobium gallicum bv. gallicum R602sp]NNH33474.1 hypothetical protein [Rhizobium sp. SEMIA 4085]